MALIGMDLLKEVTQPKRNNLFNLVPAAVNLQLSVLSVFLKEDQRSSRAESKQTEEIISTTKYIVCKWIYNLHCGCYKWEDFIQVSIGSQFCFVFVTALTLSQLRGARSAFKKV